jgi:hypothetical protein
MSVYQQLALLNDSRAIAVARVATEDLLGQEKRQTELTPELRGALQGFLGTGTVPPGSVDEATAARYALVVLADLDEDAVKRALQAGVAESVLGTIAVLTAALVILQTGVDIAKGKNGKWTVKIRKKPSSEGLLKSFIKSVLGL